MVLGLVTFFLFTLIMIKTSNSSHETKKQSSPTFSFFGFKILVRKCFETSIFYFFGTPILSQLVCKNRLPLNFLRLSHGCHLSVHFSKRYFSKFLENHFYVFISVIMTIQLLMFLINLEKKKKILKKKL